MEGSLVNIPYLIDWLAICMEKKGGGLTIGILASLNKAMIGKWTWRFAIERKTLRKIVIEGKFGEEEWGWCFSEGEDN